MSSFEWISRAACADDDVDPELFFPAGDPADEKVSAERVLQENEAKQVCRGCPVTEECLKDALNGGPSTQYGVRGGLDERERRALKRHRARTAA